MAITGLNEQGKQMFSDNRSLKMQSLVYDMTRLMACLYRACTARTRLTRQTDQTYGHSSTESLGVGLWWPDTQSGHTIRAMVMSCEHPLIISYLYPGDSSISTSFLIAWVDNQSQHTQTHEHTKTHTHSLHMGRVLLTKHMARFVCIGLTHFKRRRQ